MSYIWRYAPEGTEYSYQGNWWKTVNGIMFRWEDKKLTGSFDSGYHWARSPYTEELTEKMTPIPEDKPVYTQAMCDAGTLPPIGAKILIVEDTKFYSCHYDITYDRSTGYEAIVVSCGIRPDNGASLVTITDGKGFVTINPDWIAPLTPPIELVDGKAYQFKLNGQLIGFYRKDRKSFFTELHGGNKVCGENEPSTIQLLEVKS